MAGAVRSRLTFANVASSIALLLMLTTGVAYANHLQVFSSDIVNGEVRTNDMADDAVTTAKIALQAVTNGRLAAGSVTSGKVANDTLTGQDIASDAVGREELAHGSVGRTELHSGSPHGCCVISFFEFTVPANSCHTRAVEDPEANLGEIVLVFPESADLGAGVYMRPTVVAHPGEIIIETCNSTGSDVVIPFGTFFNIRLIA